MYSTKAVSILSVLLVLQLGGLMLSSRQDERLASFAPHETLLSIERALVHEVHVSGMNQDTLTLKKDKGAWLLPEYQNFPANSTKVEKLLETLSSMKRSFPVARSLAAQKQLRVTESDYEKKIKLRGDTEERSIYFGTTPGFKKVHARVSDEQETYSVPVLLSEIPTENKAWRDTKVLHIDRDKIQGVRFPQLELENRDGEMVLVGLLETERMNKEAVDKLLVQFSKMSYVDVLEAAPVEDVSEAFRVTLRYDDDKEREYVFSMSGDRVMLSVSDMPFRFEVGKGPMTLFKRSNRASLVHKDESDTPDQQDGASASMLEQEQRAD